MAIVEGGVVKGGVASGGCGVSVVWVCRRTCPRFLLVSGGYEPVHGGLVIGDLGSLLFALRSEERRVGKECLE